MRDRAATTELGMGASERRAQQESKVLGTPRRNEPRAALARPGQCAASARTACAGLRVFTEGFDTRDLKEAKALLEEFDGLNNSRALA
jgi:hypothetical protein